MKKKKDLIVLILLLFFCLPALRPFLPEGLFPAHDAPVFVLRSHQLDKALGDGQFPVRWAQDFNFRFGYPVFNFVYPLLCYLTQGFHYLGFSFTDSVKLLFLSSFLFSGVTMYFLAKEFFGKFGGMISALLYFYAPFHAVGLYVRGSLGELLVMVFFPWLLLAVYKRKFILAGIVLALIILSHNILAMISFALLLGFMLMELFTREKAKQRALVYGFLITVFLGLGLSSFFWLPAILEKKYIIFDQVALKEFNFRDHFVYPVQLRYSPWGFAGSMPGPIDGMSFKLGKIHILFSLIGFFSIFFLKTKKMVRKIVAFSGFIFLTSVFLSLNLSRFLWENLPILELVQFPWRFLSFTAFAMAILGGTTVLLIKKIFKKKFFYLSLFFMSSLIIIFNVDYFKAGPGDYKNDEQFLTEEEILTSNSTYGDELLPFWVQEMPTELPASKIELTGDKGEVLDLEFKSNLIKAKIMAPEETQVKINNFYFPGWQLFINGKKQAYEVLEPLGNIGTILEKGEHLLELRLLSTVVQRLSNIISFLSLFSLLFLLCRKKLKF